MDHVTVDGQPGEVSDEVLVVRSQGGDRSAFEQLVRRTARLVYSRIHLDCGGSGSSGAGRADPHRTEDLVQETFLIAWRSIHQVTDPRGFRPWLMTIARSVTNDAFRRDSRQKRFGGRRAADNPDDVFLRLADAGPTPPQKLEQEEARRRALEMLRDLPPEYSLPLTLRYIAGADYETIGRQLGLSNGSLRGLLNRGMAKLRERMRQEE